MDVRSRIGTCLPVFVLAIVLDLLGLVVLLVGIFADLRVSGRFYGDFLIYSGALVLFLTLFLWLMWYVGNLRVSVDLGPDRSTSISRLARKLTERLSRRLGAAEPGPSPDPDEEQRPAKASRVTWGRSTVFHNEGYDASLDSPADEVHT